MVDNFLIKLEQLRREGKWNPTAGLHCVSVAHDATCGIYRRERCDCDPDIRFVSEAEYQRLLEGQR